MDKHTYQSALQSLKNALEPVAAFMDDPKVQEIEINGANNVWVETSGVQARVEVLITDEQIKRAIQVLARMSNKDAKGGTKDGIIDARMDGFRVAAALAPTSVRGASICIRKHNPVLLTLDDYVNGGSFTAEWATYMRTLISGHKNLLVCGGTSSGKTTYVNALINEIDPKERVLTIEDTPELKVSSPNWVSFESNEQANITTRDLVRLSLRYRPDRIIVGEVRGGEAYDLLDAANTGHDGCIATMHANSSFDALSRFENLILRGGIDWPHDAIRAQIARTFDCVIFMARRNGIRQLSEILELKDFNMETKKYEFNIVFRSSKN